MSTEIERIRKLVHDNLVVDAIELPSNHKKKSQIVDDIEEVLNQFDDDVDYAHFVVRVKRSAVPLSQALKQTDNSSLSDTGSDLISLVDQTLEVPAEKHELPTDRDPEQDPEFLLENARILEENGEFALARNIYAAVIKSGSNIPQGHAGLARTYEKDGLLEQAIRSYREAIAYSSELAFYQAMAALQIRIGDDKEAAKTLIHALGIPTLTDEDRFEFHKSLGNCFTRIGAFDKAEHHYARAYEYRPISDVLQVNVGSLALQKNDLSAAVQHFEKALEINPGNDKAICGIGMVYQARNESEKAFDYFTAALKANPSNLTALFNFSKCSLELRKYEDAATAIEKYLSMNAANTNILFSYAGILFHKGDIEGARSQLEKLLKIEPNHTGAIELRDIIARRK